MPENIVVIEEALIPEDKVIATDKQQSEDLFNQLVKNSKSLDSRISAWKFSSIQRPIEILLSRTL